MFKLKFKIIDSDRLDAAAAIIQHLASFINVNQLASDIEISDDHMKELVSLTGKVKDLQVLRQRLQIDMANQVCKKTDTLFYFIFFVAVDKNAPNARPIWILSYFKENSNFKNADK